VVNWWQGIINTQGKKMKGNKNNNVGEKRATNHNTVTQHMGIIHLTSTSKYHLTYVTGHSF